MTGGDAVRSEDGIQVVLVSAPDEHDAHRIAQALVVERLAACVSVLPSVQSTYRWEGRVETTEELLLLVKTTRARVEEVTRRVLELHSYDLPEVVALPVDGGLGRYLDWVGEETGSGEGHDGS